MGHGGEGEGEGGRGRRRGGRWRKREEKGSERGREKKRGEKASGGSRSIKLGESCGHTYCSICRSLPAPCPGWLLVSAVSTGGLPGGQQWPPAPHTRLAHTSLYVGSRVPAELQTCGVHTIAIYAGV